MAPPSGLRRAPILCPVCAVRAGGAYDSWRVPLHVRAWSDLLNRAFLTKLDLSREGSNPRANIFNPKLCWSHALFYIRTPSHLFAQQRYGPCFASCRRGRELLCSSTSIHTYLSDQKYAWFSLRRNSRHPTYGTHMRMMVNEMKIQPRTFLLSKKNPDLESKQGDKKQAEP